MPSVEEYLRSTERPRRVSLPAPVATRLPARVRRRASAKRPPRIQGKSLAPPQSKLRRAFGIAFLVGLAVLIAYSIAQDDHDRSPSTSPSIVTIATFPSTSPLPVVFCPVSQRPGLTATEDVVIALVQVRAAVAANPVADCARHVWTLGVGPAVDDFYKLGTVRSAIAVSDIDGAPNAEPGAIVHFTLSNNATSIRFETQLTRSLDGREWRLAYLRAVPA
jgi:hypothetical protein